jgi:hypothetical protein
MTSERRRLFSENGGKCAYCKRQTEMPSLLPGSHHDLTATVEHIVPISRGGNMKGENTTLACLFCNNLKAGMTPQEWAEFMMMNPQWWIRAKRTTARLRRFASRQVLPIEESQMILRQGKKAWRTWRDAQTHPRVVCPVITMVAQFFVDKRYGIWRPRNPDQHL